MKDTTRKYLEKNMVHDDITNYGITIIGGEMYLVKDDKRMKLSSLIIKEVN
jgi:hypothetical protein|tara:strand:- start:330 stop:482 length:153 start_codon:yes stop_codon:yes gene_type:complete